MIPRRAGADNAGERTGAKACMRGRSVQLSCGGNVRWAKGAHANEPKASSVESNSFGFVCGGFATFESAVMSDAQRLIPSIAAANDHQNQ
jgi:hypothetical protein